MNMDASFRSSPSPTRPVPALTTSYSLMIPPSTPPKSRMDAPHMRRSVSTSQLTSSKSAFMTGSLKFPDTTLSFIHTQPSTPIITSTIDSGSASPRTQWPSIEIRERTDEDDYAWYFRNPHRYIRRPRARLLRRQHHSSTIPSGADSRRRSQTGDRDGGEDNMRLFAAYLGRHYAATPLSVTFSAEPDPSATSEYVPPVTDDARATLPREDHMTNDDDRSTIFSTSGEDWDAPTLTNGSVYDSKLSCDIKRPSCDDSSLLFPFSTTSSPASPYVTVDRSYQPLDDLTSSWDSKITGPSVAEKGTPCSQHRDAPPNSDSMSKHGLLSSSRFDSNAAFLVAQNLYFIIL